MQWVPAPLSDAEMTRDRFTETIKYENGGGDARKSSAFQKQYTFNYNRPLKGSEELGVFNKFASGFYGNGLLCFADPYIFDINMFNEVWSTPGLSEYGWPNIYEGDPTFEDLPDPLYEQPRRKAVYTITADANTPPARASKIFTIPIPPTHTLWMGASGEATGTAVVQVRPIDANGAYTTASNLTLLDPNGATRMNASFAGSSYSAVEVYLARTSSAASTITLASMMAQLHPTGTTPTLTGDHQQGLGHTGLMFLDDAQPESYVYIDPPRKALTTTLFEVGAWR